MYNINNTDNFDFNDINISDKINYFCQLISFNRYSLRLISAYIIVVFTIQRTIVLRLPLLQSKFESKKNAWLNIIIISLISILLSSWVPLLFNNHHESIRGESEKFCDVTRNYYDLYFHLTIVYIFLITIFPIIIIFICNSFSIYVLVIKKKYREDVLRVSYSSPNSILTNNIRLSKIYKCDTNGKSNTNG